MTRRLGRLMAQPGGVAALVLAGLVLLPVAVWLDLKRLSEASLERQARTLDLVVSDIRAYYAGRIVDRVEAHDGDSRALADYDLVPGAVPIPATLSLELAEVIGGHGQYVGYRFVSDYPFAGREPHRLDAFEEGALAAFRAGAGAGHLVSADGGWLDRSVRLAAPVVMGEACVACHNTHPESPRTDWQVGDVRGIQTIALDQPLAANLASFRSLLAYFVGAGLLGGAFVLAQARQAREMGRVNAELEAANGFLASVSAKIARYLSPQVYRSIFSGERDATLTTERKKLTVFFSDIADFALTSERLQPEELTALLNDYFTEMAGIAEAHGATVDKFIGDAILAFFGDPETRGTREDARACVAMALAMQRRLGELEATWRARGIERPFRVRIGINTGYCNVGNFGSADRMDYTIIGAEANLAARLQQIAPPGGIVMSYETLIHVEDMVRTRPLPPISLKGLARTVTPFATQAPGEADAPGVIDEQACGARLFLDPARLDGAERDRLRTALADALRRLDGNAEPAIEGGPRPADPP